MVLSVILGMVLRIRFSKSNVGRCFDTGGSSGIVSFLQGLSHGGCLIGTGRLRKKKKNQCVDYMV